MLKSNQVVALSEDNRKKNRVSERRSFSCSFNYKDLQKQRRPTGTLYLVSNELESSADRIYKVYQKQWRKESYSLHQSLLIAISNFSERKLL